MTTTVSLSYSKDHCNYSTHKVFLVFPSHCSVAASNGGRSSYSGFPNCPRPRLQKLSTNPTPLDCSSQLVLLITSRNGQHRKHRSSLAVSNPCRACLRSRYSLTAVVYLLISWSLPSSGSACHNT
jgi:hypothetical protein